MGGWQGGAVSQHQGAQKEVQQTAYIALRVVVLVKATSSWFVTPVLLEYVLVERVTWQCQVCVHTRAVVARQATDVYVCCCLQSSLPKFV
jgi:hypothetical protein